LTLIGSGAAFACAVSVFFIAKRLDSLRDLIAAAPKYSTVPTSCFAAFRDLYTPNHVELMAATESDFL
jgi:hypothetical protein